MMNRKSFLTLVWQGYVAWGTEKIYKAELSTLPNIFTIQRYTLNTE